MQPAHILLVAINGLNEATKDSFKGTDIEALQNTIKAFAISSAVAGGIAGAVPGATLLGGLAQTGIVWTMYVKINKQLGINLSKNTMKFIGSAMMTNIIANAGSLILGYVGATIISLIPGFGQIGGPVLGMGLGYVVVYISAVLYFKLLTKVFKATGSFEMDETAATKEKIKEVINEANMKDIIREGKNAFKEAKQNGDIDRAKKSLKCPSCGADITAGQKFCSECGGELK